MPGASEFTCPHCRSVLRSNKALPAGKSVTCPNCQKAFQAADEHDITNASTIRMKAPIGILDLEAPVTGGAGKGSAKPRNLQDDEGEDQTFSSPGLKPSNKRLMLTLAVVGIVVVSLSLGVCAGVIVMLYLR